MATDDKLAEDKKKLKAENDARQKATAEREKNRGTPTPTQEEADLLKLGHPVELAADGSPPDPNDPSAKTKEATAQHSGGYSTRQATPHQATHRPRE